MNPIDELNAYLKRLESRLRLATWSRGAAIAVVVALAATVLLVTAARGFAFSQGSLTASRILLFLSLAAALLLGLVLPLLTLNRRRAARKVEEKYPEFQQRLLTLAERSPAETANPFVELLAADTMKLARETTPGRVIPPAWIAGSIAAAVAAGSVLLWMIVSGPGVLGYGAGLLWAGAPREGMEGFYRILVRPGNRTVRRNSDQMVTARLAGFEAKRVRLMARYRGATKWEEVDMTPQSGGADYGFLLAGIPETVDYHVDASGVRSETYTIKVKDLPAVKEIRAGYQYPSWTGLKPVVEEHSGDLRAVEGTVVELKVETSKQLEGGFIVFDDGRHLPLTPAGGNWTTASFRLDKDGTYYVAVLDEGELIRLSKDYFVEAAKNRPPVVRISRPGRDEKVSPIEEVPVAVEAEDQFGLQGLQLHYSVNGGPEQTVDISKARGTKKTDGQTTLYLENFKLVPGDVVSMYATARNAILASNTDIYFLKATPFEFEYSQSQQSGGGSGGDMQNRISQRQEEIIAATWNQVKEPSKDPAAARENARFLSDVEGKLRDQAKSLAERMKRRQLSFTNREFQSFADDMQKAAEAMHEAVGQLKGLQWKSALPPEQKALQHLLRAESTMREIQVAFGGQGQGAGGGRDLESLFDLELDTEKNQYETGQQAASASERAKEIDNTLQKLEELARRQQALAEQKRQAQSFEQRWQQEMLRREAEQLQRKMEQLVREGAQSGEGSSQSSQGKESASSSSSGKSSQTGRAQEQSRSAMNRRPGADPRLQQALERMSKATEDMRRAGNSQNSQAGQGDAESRRAAERLQEAQELLRGMRQQESSQKLDELVKNSESLATQQREFANRLRQATGGPDGMQGTGQTDTQALAREKQDLYNRYQKLAQDLQSGAREMAGSQPKAASKLREGLAEAQQNELGLRLKYSAEYLKRGYGYSWTRELPMTQGLDNLNRKVKEAQSALNGPQQGTSDVEKALSRVEQLRDQLERMAQGRKQDADRSGAQRGNRQGQPQEGQAGDQSGREQGAPSGQQGNHSDRGQQAGSPGRTQGGSPEGQPGGQRGGSSAANPGESATLSNGGPAPELGSPEGIRAYNDGLRDLSQLRQMVGRDPEIRDQIQRLMRDMQGISPQRLSSNPELLERVQNSILPALEELELQLRRKVDGEREGTAHAGPADPVPPGYGDAVAEYFRRLSKGH